MKSHKQSRKQSGISQQRKTPEPEAGINKVSIQEDLPIFQLIIGEYVDKTSKEVLWIDSGNESSTYALSNAGSPELLHQVKIGRAFTAFQHYHLVNRIEEFLKPETEYLILPNIDQQYKTGNVSEKEAEELFADVLDKLQSLQNERSDLKILYSIFDSRPHEINMSLQSVTNNSIDIEKTSQGLKKASEQEEQLYYRKNGDLQTTIPFWNKKQHENPENTVKVDYDGKNKLHV